MILFESIAAVFLILFVIHYFYFVISVLTAQTSPDQATMDPQDAKYIKKRWKAKAIEPHPTENAIIVNYKLEAAVFGDPDQAMLEEKKDCQRIIRLKSLGPKTNPALLAREVVEKCDLIHSSQVSDVEQIIYYLKNRKDSDMDNNNQRLSSRSTDKLAMSTKEAEMTNGGPVEKASIRIVETYVDLLYDELLDKIRGSSLILQLARNPDNLDELAKNGAVLNALSRVLREDWKKSLDLSTNIVYIFFCFSTYTHFHPVIVNHKIGSLCMDVIEYELRRFDQMKADLEYRKNPDSAKCSRASAENSGSSSADNLDLEQEERPREMEPPKRRIPELKQRPKSGNWGGANMMSTSNVTTRSSSSLLKSRTMTSSYHEFLSNEFDAKDLAAETEPRSEDVDKLTKQFKVFAKKQEQLLRVAFYLLLNIAENVKLEEKMRKKNIVRMLVKALDRQNIDLIVLVVTFLKKLAIVRDNKDDMFELNVIEKLPRLLNSHHPDLIQGTLKLIFNLSFDGRCRCAMVRAGFLPKLVQFLSDDKHHDIVLKILYHMSLDDKVKSMFTYTDCVALITDMLLLNLNQKSDLDLIALAINLALNKRNAQIMVENNRLHSLMARAFKYQDALLMKMIRNISHHDHLRGFFVDFVGDLAKILTMSDDEAFVVECVGILGNLALPDLDYSQLLQNFDLIKWIKNVLIYGDAKDDLVLDTIIFLGTCASDESCAMLLCKADVLLALIELLKAKQEDDEIVLQIIFVFQQVLRNDSMRDYVIRDTEAPAYLIDLMHDKNAEIRKVCDVCLDIIAFTDAEWAARIKLENFRNHNAQWLSMVETLQEDDHNDDHYSNGTADVADLEDFVLDQCKFYGGGSAGGETGNFRSSSAATSTQSPNNNSRPMSGTDFDGDFGQDNLMLKNHADNLELIDDEPFLLA